MRKDRDETLWKLKCLVNWADEKEDFDATFIEKMIEVYLDKGSLTEKQDIAIDNIIDGFKIDLREWDL
jgi:hypothetical protein